MILIHLLLLSRVEEMAVPYKLTAPESEGSSNSPLLADSSPNPCFKKIPNAPNQLRSKVNKP